MEFGKFHEFDVMPTPLDTLVADQNGADPLGSTILLDILLEIKFHQLLANEMKEPYMNIW